MRYLTIIFVLFLQLAALADGPSKGDWARVNLPGAQHKLIDGLAGEWETSMVVRYGLEEKTIKGRAIYQWVLGKRYLEERTSSWIYRPGIGDYDEFQGMGLIGYDRGRGVFTSSWADNQSTQHLMRSGQFDEKTKTLSFFGTAYSETDPSRTVHFKAVREFLGPNQHRFSYYKLGGDQDQLLFQIDYKRIK